MSTWQWGVAGGFLVTGAVLAIATTTSNRMRWAVLAPTMWGAGMVFIAISSRDWEPVAIGVGMLSYATINYIGISREARPKRDD